MTDKNEIFRQLREVDRMNKAAMPTWRDTLHRVFAPGSGVTTDEKAALLGVPTPGRRQLFRLGGGALLGAAVLAACGDDDEPTESGGDTTTPGSTDTSTDGGGASMDIVLARTAASLEKLAVDVYGNEDAAALVETEAIGAAAELFQSHHQDHLDALNAVLDDAGFDKVEEPNAAVFEALVAPAVAAAKSEADIVALALALENAAAQTYVFAGGQLSTPALRSTIMTIGGIEARHAAILVMAAQGKSPLDVFPAEGSPATNSGFFPNTNPLDAIPGSVLMG